MNYLKEIYFLLGDKRRKIPWLISIFLISSILDLVGIGLIAPYMLLILSPDSLSTGFFSVWVEVLGSSFTKDEWIIISSLVLLCVFLLKAVSAIIINRVIINFSWELQTQLKTILMTSYSNLTYIEYLRRNSSEYIQAVVSFTSQFTNGVLQSLLRMISEGVAAIAILIMLAFTNGTALILLVLLLASTSLGYDRFFRRHTKEYGRQANIHTTRMLKGINEVMEGLKEIRVLGKAAHFLQVVADSAKQSAYYSSKSQVITTSPRYVLELILVAFVTLLVIGTILADNDIKLLVPTLSMFGVAAMRLLPSANTFLSSMSLLRVGRHTTSRLYNDLKNIDRENAKVGISTSSSVSFRTLEFKDVCFHYPDTEINALNNLSLTIREGESIGLIGTSGSGKTTLVDTMLGLFIPQSGEIKFNNKPLQQMLNEWRENVAYLPQNILLLDNTLKCNVALGVPEDKINERKLFDALQQARLKELADSLPNGIETMLGERGVRLSGGQRQRVALARAFYHDRNVLIMDEATSALDNETEQEIVDEIKQLKGNKTLIVIAHRLTTVQHCDRIYRLGNGKIIEQGTYNEVIAKHLAKDNC